MVTQQEKRTVQVGNIEAQVTVAGQGAPLVYLHGSFGYQQWPKFLDSLTDKFTVYAPLSPGFGENDGLEQIDYILDLTLYNYDLLESLGLESPIVVGHHIGAMIAAEMAAICPQSVSKLVLAAPAGVWLDDNPGVDYFATPANELRQVLFASSDSSEAMSTMPDPESDDQRAIQNLERVRSLAAVGKFLWPIPDKGIKKRLGRIKAHTLVVMGDVDQIVPSAYGNEFASRIPNASVSILENAGHMALFEQPDQFSRVVTEFLGV